MILGKNTPLTQSLNITGIDELRFYILPEKNNFLMVQAADPFAETITSLRLSREVLYRPARVHLNQLHIRY